MTASLSPATSSIREVARPAQSVRDIPVITNIQAMRGLASVMVIIGHVLLLQPGLGLDRAFPFFGVIASSGVDIFFVISGFIISTVAMRSGRASRGTRHEIAWNFGVKRLTRIYPVYWIVFALAFALTPVVHFAPDFVKRMPAIQQFLLLTHTNSYIMAAWSLCFEMYFYAAVTVALWISPRHVGRVIAIWAIGASAVILYDTFIAHRSWIAIVPFSPLVLEFIFGMVVAFLINRRITDFAVTAVVLGIILFIVGLEVMRLRDWWTLAPWWRTMWSGLPSMLIIYGVVALEVKRGWKFASLWSTFGDASYSIYIWHQFLFYSMLKICESTGLLGHAGWMLIPVWLAVGLIVGFISYNKIELPIQSYLNGRLTRRAA
jgi:peptidoglycan/LPS O-acetylase OafA/YrhL